MPSLGDGTSATRDAGREVRAGLGALAGEARFRAGLTGDGRRVFLVDDVLFSGRTVRAALDATGRGAATGVG